MHDWPPVHALPQLPQFASLFVKFVHTPLHRDCPAGQTHAVPLQVWPPVHVLPQLPQLVLVVTLVHTPLQRSSFAAHSVRHVVPTHSVLPVQALPHEPQLASLFVKFVQTPLQSTSGAVQIGLHVVPLQT